MDTFDILKRLCGVAGVAGDESGAERAGQAALELLKAYDPDAKTDAHGSVVGFIGDRENGKPVILLDAHLDEIGLIATHIDEKGFIKAECVGGVDRRLLPAQAVTVWGRRLPVKGVVCSLPPHVAKDGEKALPADKINIDTGYSKEELEKLVSLGDRITVDGELTRLLNGKVCGKALDDRAGIAAVLYALSLLQNSDIGFNVAVSFSAQEELGCRGSRITAYNADPEYAIVVDVSYGMSPGCDEHKCGKLGGGPMLGIAPSLDCEMFEEMKKVAKSWDIQYQVEVMNRDTGTNTDEICLVRGGVKTALISIPERYMHTPVETVAIEDIEAAGALIAAFIENWKE